MPKYIVSITEDGEELYLLDVSVGFTDTKSKACEFRSYEDAFKLILAVSSTQYIENIQNLMIRSVGGARIERMRDYLKHGREINLPLTLNIIDVGTHEIAGSVTYIPNPIRS